MAPGPVVSNASPLILLAGIGRLDVLQSLFVAVEISQEVRDEVTIRGAGRSGAAEVASAPFVCTGELPPASRTAQLAREHGIGLGEASTLALAETRRARLVLMDDRKARGVTLANGFAVAGTVGVLERAFEQGFLADLREVYVKLRSGTGWIAPDILNESLERHSLTRIG